MKEVRVCARVSPLVWLSLYITAIHHSSLSPLGQLITFSCSLTHIKKTSPFQTVWTDFILPLPPFQRLALSILWTQGSLQCLSPRSVKLSSALAEVRLSGGPALTHQQTSEGLQQLPERCLRYFNLFWNRFQ